MLLVQRRNKKEIEGKLVGEPADTLPVGVQDGGGYYSFREFLPLNNSSEKEAVVHIVSDVTRAYVRLRMVPTCFPCLRDKGGGLGEWK